MTKKTKLKMVATWELIQWAIGFIGSGFVVLGLRDKLMAYLYSWPPFPRPNAPVEAMLLGLVLIAIRVLTTKSEKVFILFSQIYLMILLFSLCLISKAAYLIFGLIFGDRQYPSKQDYILCFIGLLLLLACYKVLPTRINKLRQCNKGKNSNQN